MRAETTASSPHFAKLCLMYRHKLLLSLAAGLLAALTLPSPAQTYGDEVVCYFSSWARWRPGDGMFDVENIDPFLCTHVIFSFAGLSNVTWELEVLDPWNELCPSEDGYYCAYDRFVALKETNPELVTLLAVGGWREGSEDYSVMAADPNKRKSFIDSSIARMLKHGFDGMDMDWEYPGSRGGSPEDKDNFVTLMQELREAFDEQDDPLMLTFAAAAGKEEIDLAYDVPRLVPFVDKWHVMAYDYHGAWENFTHHHSTLCGYYLDPEEYATFNVRFTAEYYLSLGVPKEKMVLGVATYGRCWTLDNLADHEIYSPASGPGRPGPYIQIEGTLGFNEICEKLQDAGDDCEIVHDPHLLEPYFYCRSDNMWCSYDDGDSIYTKGRYARNLGLAGVLVWQIDTDDFQPFCYAEPFHLIHQVKRAVKQPQGGPDEVVCPDDPTYTSTIDVTVTVPDTTTIAIDTTTTVTDTTTTATDTTTTVTDTTTTVTDTTTTVTDTTTTVTDTTTTATDTTTTETTTTTTTTTTPPPTTITTTTPTPTTTTTIRTSVTTLPISTTTRHPSIRPDCTGLSDGHTFPHSDCNKYWECVNEVGILELCSPGTMWDDSLKVCNWEEEVDTSNCYTWICSVDNTFYSHPDCDKYYWCYQGSPHVEQCPNGNYWSQEVTQCVDPSNADTSTCNIP